MVSRGSVVHASTGMLVQAAMQFYLAKQDRDMLSVV